MTKSILILLAIGFLSLFAIYFLIIEPIPRFIVKRADGKSMSGYENNHRQYPRRRPNRSYGSDEKK
jgi:hypothetical protein